MGSSKGRDQSIDWHNVDEEFNEFARKQLDEIDTVLFGRVTYEGMASYWPTAGAIEDDPIVAGKMNSMPKIVFSRTLQTADWENTNLVKDNIAEEVQRLKEQPGGELAIFGSSDLTTSLLQMGLVDELRIMVNPVVLGQGKRLFEGIDKELHLQLLATTAFRSGNVLMRYRVLP